VYAQQLYDPTQPGSYNSYNHLFSHSQQSSVIGLENLKTMFRDEGINMGLGTTIPSYSREMVASPFSCYKCGEPGHIAKYCPNTAYLDNMGTRAPSSRSEGCYKCGQTGHIAKECPNGTNNFGGGFGGRPDGGVSGGPASSPLVCYRCG